MLPYDNYRRHDALGLAKLVKEGAVTPEELLETAIARLEAVNPKINAVIHKMYDQARAAIGRIDRAAPFAGVPFLVKDLGVEVEGEPMRVGSRGYEGNVSPRDSFVVKKMRAAGLLLFGKTSTPEFGLTPFTEPVLFGPVNNPWNLGHTTGGSSGGSAAAVAAGVVPMATANDGGGSIRIPASCCGLFGLKPSRGRTSWSPLYGEMWNGAAVEGCVSRTVRDSAAYLDAVQGAAPGDPYIIQAPERPYLEEIHIPPGKLRIGYSTAHTLGHEVDPACIHAVKYTVDILREHGHVVEETALPYERDDLKKSFLVMAAAETAAEFDILSQFLGRKVRPSDVEQNTYALALLGRTYSAVDYALMKRSWNTISLRIAAYHEKYDLLLTPTLAQRPFRSGSIQTTAAEKRLLTVVNALDAGKLIRAQIDSLADKVYDFIPWTPFANISGQPSMSIPAYWTEENLPVGVMFTGRLNDEATLFRLAAQLEQAINWEARGLPEV